MCAEEAGGAEADPLALGLGCCLLFVLFATLLLGFPDAKRSFSRTSYAPSSTISFSLLPPPLSSSVGNMWSEIECAGGMYSFECRRADTGASGKAYISCDAGCGGPMEERSEDGPSGKGLYGRNGATSSMETSFQHLSSTRL